MRYLVLACVLLAGCQGQTAPVVPASTSAPVVAATSPTPAPESFALAALPPDPSFPHADDEAAARWGQRAFYDARLSVNGKFACVTCHEAERSFTDGLPRAKAIEEGPRNTPTLLYAAYHQWQGWGGRADSLWSQSIAALENPKEQDLDHVRIARYVADHERAAYESLYGPFPDTTAWPTTGGPGDAAYDALTDAEKHEIEEVVARQGQALASYVRKLVPAPSAFDRFIAGDATALTTQEQQGFDLFRGKASCVACHKGPLFSDDEFHDLGTPLPVAPPYDNGRADDLPKLLADPFNGMGDFVLTKKPLPAISAEDLGKFRTPSLRNVAVTAPYMHLGNFVSLAAVIDFDSLGGGLGSHHFYIGKVDPQLKANPLTGAERDAIIAFLGTLTSGSVPAPWDTAPDPATNRP